MPRKITGAKTRLGKIRHALKDAFAEKIERVRRVLKGAFRKTCISKIRRVLKNKTCIEKYKIGHDKIN